MFGGVSARLEGTCRLLNVIRRDNTAYAVETFSIAHIHRNDARVSVGATENCRVKHARQREVVHVAPAA